MNNDAISRSAVLEVVKKAQRYVVVIPDTGRGYDGAVLIDEIMSGFNKLPALDVAPVVHARWIPYDEARPGMYFSHRCSNCGGSVEHAYLMRPSSFSDFCPNCGARMDGEENAAD